MPKAVPGWKAPIVVGRHAHADQYRSQGLVIDEPGTLELVFTPTAEGQQPKRLTINRFEGPGVGLGMFNTAKVSVPRPIATYDSRD